MGLKEVKVVVQVTSLVSDLVDLENQNLFSLFPYVTWHSCRVPCGPSHTEMLDTNSAVLSTNTWEAPTVVSLSKHSQMQK
jgi:hypothetical protein